MPSTFTGLLILMVSLAPGFIYFSLVERGERPGRQFSVFRETSQVVVASLLANGVALAVFAVARIRFPESTPDFGQLVRTPTAYWAGNYRGVLAWGTALFLFACLVSYLWGAHALGPRLAARLLKHKLGRAILPLARVRFVSAWWTLFKDDDPDAHQRIRCRLSDGSEITGWLHSFNHEADEIADRELTLSGPLVFTEADGTTRINEYGVVSVSARSLQLMEVNYFDSKEPTNDDILESNAVGLREGKRRRGLIVSSRLIPKRSGPSAPGR